MVGWKIFESGLEVQRKQLDTKKRGVWKRGENEKGKKKQSQTLNALKGGGGREEEEQEEGAEP